ncbi:CHAT domain-containing protein [Acaryochloris marina]|uniref:CHAT domain-containing protein n=1 Tax=Acaryochloris marina TaxID=155978 RepID=UPI001BAFD9EB|nr:CHAT domain-containing protein [Acaryochloris marina]QUY45625.1 CHAT domain-containing protein [Acaryochloris marina S15]
MKHIAKILLLSLLLIPSAKAADLTPLDKADALTVQGNQQLDQGNPSGAFTSFEKAQSFYQEINNEEGIRGSRINKALAHQQLGQYLNACREVSLALAIERYCQSDAPTTPLVDRTFDTTDLIALQNLGKIFQELGYLERSETVLTLAIANAKQQGNQAQQLASQQTLANTRTIQVRSAIQKFQISGEALVQATQVKAAEKTAKQAFADYEALDISQARLGWLSLYDDLDQWIASDGPGIFEMVELRDSLQSKRGQILQTLLQSDLNALSPISRVYAHLKISKIVAKQSGKLSGKHPLVLAFEQAQTAQNLANELDNYRALSFVYGQLGRLYQQSGQSDLSMRSYELAAQFAQSIQAWDGLYQWRSALAQQYEDQGQTQQAITSYTSAISALEHVRWNLLPVTSDLQFSFKEQVEPVYQQYMGLLLETDNPDLTQVSQVNQSLRLAELENYLKCGETNLVPLAQAQDSQQVVVQILDLGDQTTVIVGDTHYTVDPNQLKTTIDELTVALQGDNFYDMRQSQYLPLLQSLYQQILEPAVAKNLILEETPIKFHLSGPLQNIPMALLHDGKRYLIERNPVALSNGYVRESIPPSRQPGAVVGGVSTNSPSLQKTALAPLPEVAEEVGVIQATFPDAKLILNKDFTYQNILKNVEKPTSKILHLSTHGQFSSDPTQTFLLAWDRPLNVKDISGVLEAGSGGGLDLLFLSACHSAQGDPRSLLGLAGLSAQSGANNTVASLWSADAAASVLVSQEFYAAVKNQKPMNEALRQAQLKLLKSEYAHPYYWANYVLVQL